MPEEGIRTMTVVGDVRAVGKSERHATGRGGVSRWALGYLALLACAALAAPILAPYGFNQQDYAAVLQGPSGGHLLGTDELGRDVLSRLLYGGRVSMESMLIAVAVGAGFGVPAGLISGFVGRWVDAVTMRIADTLLAFPTLVLAIAVTAALGRGTVRVMVAVGIVIAPSFARMMRAQVLVVKNRLYVDAAKSFGMSRLWIIARHVAPNAIQPVLVLTAHMLGVVLLVEASLSFLGLGTPPPYPSWGGMLREATRNSGGLAIQIIAPGLVIASTLLAVNLVGDRLRDALDPRATRQNRRREPPGA